jgi:hypothetical protein
MLDLSRKDIKQGLPQTNSLRASVSTDENMILPFHRFCDTEYHSRLLLENRTMTHSLTFKLQILDNVNDY